MKISTGKMKFIHNKIFMGSLCWIGALIVSVYFGTASWLSTSIRYLSLACYMFLSASIFIGIFVYALYATKKHRRLDAILLLITSMMLLFIIAPIPLFQGYTYLQEAMREWKSSLGQKEQITTLKSYNELQALVSKTKKPLIVKCSAVWCPPCKRVRPVYHKIAGELKDKIVFADIDYDSFDGKDKLDIKGIPAFIGYKRGKEKLRFSGALEYEQLKEKFSILIN